MIIDCSTCGQKYYNFKREGLFIQSSAYNGQKMFLIQQLEPSGVIFVTEPALELLKAEGFTNLRAELAGQIDI